MWQIIYVSLMGSTRLVTPVYHHVPFSIQMICKPCCKQYKYCWQDDEAGWHNWLASSYNELSDGLHNLPSTACALSHHFQDCILAGKSEWVPLHKSQFIWACLKYSSSKALHSFLIKWLHSVWFKVSCSQCYTSMFNAFRLSFKFLNISPGLCCECFPVFSSL